MADQSNDTDVTSAGQGTGGTQGTGQEKTAFDYETWLSAQPDDVKAGLESHTAGLKSALDKERAARKKRDDEIKADEDKRKAADLTEVERAKKTAADWETKYNESIAEFDSQRIRNTVEMAAMRLNFANPKDAYLLAELSGVSVADDGVVSGVDEALKNLLKDKPYLVKAAGNEGQGTPRPGNNRGAGAPTPEELVERKRRASGTNYRSF